MTKFVLFANARSGSTSLAKLLNESPDVKLCIEPFHPNYNVWNPSERNYSEFIKNKETMNQALDELFEKFNAIKVLVYQFDEEIYKEMLGRESLKIVFLRRRNLAQAALSSLIGQQTSIWHKEDLDESKYLNLKPIEISEIKNIVDYIGKMNGIYANYMETKRDGDYLNLFYEDLYSDLLDVNIKKISEICNFLDISLPPTEAIEKYMTPANAKQNQHNLYKKIPNWKEIENHYPEIFN